jgi:sugar phosphate isomerase/epimerase
LKKTSPEPVFGFGCWAFMYGCDDRFGRGYNPFPLTLEEVFDVAAATDGIDYVFGHHPGEFPDDVATLAGLATTRGVGIGCVVARTFGAAFKNGGLTNPDPRLREQAIGIVARCLELNNALRPVMDRIGKEQGCRYSVNWLGHDGSNGLFTTDYSARWDALARAYAEVFRRVKGCSVALEPKPGDPAEDCFVRAAVHGIYLARRVDALLPAADRGRLGLNIEYGHEHLAGGKLSEALCLALDERLLLQIDLNDNRKRWDTDHIPGNDNEQEILEAEYWLHHKGFGGIFNFDLYPQRVAGGSAAHTRRRLGEHLAECVNSVRYRRALIELLPPPEEMRELYADPDETRVSRLLRETRNRRVSFEVAAYTGAPRSRTPRPARRGRRSARSRTGAR